MAITFPYALSFLSDKLRARDVKFDLQTGSEFSGSGDGRFWSATLHRPLWTVAITLGFDFLPMAREIDAKMRKLGEGKRSFLFEDKSYWPACGIYPGNTPTIASIGATRESITISNLPASYRIYPGDRFSFNYGTSAYFGEFAEGDATVAADPNVRRPAVPGTQPAKPRTTVALEINPPLPLGVNVGQVIELHRPVLRVFVPPKGYTPFSSIRMTIGDGASISLMQKVGNA